MERKLAPVATDAASLVKLCLLAPTTSGPAPRCRLASCASALASVAWRVESASGTAPLGCASFSSSSEEDCCSNEPESISSREGDSASRPSRHVRIEGVIEEGEPSMVRTLNWDGLLRKGDEPLRRLMERRMALQVGSRFDLAYVDDSDYLPARSGFHR